MGLQRRLFRRRVKNHKDRNQSKDRCSDKKENKPVITVTITRRVLWDEHFEQGVN